HLAQRPVQDVRGGVIAADPVAAHFVDRGLHLVADADRPAPDDAVVDDDRAGDAVSGVADVDDGSIGHGLAQRRYRAGVADLAAGLRVEGCAVERDLHRSALGRLIDGLARDDAGDDRRLADRLTAAGELRGPELVEDFAPDGAVTGRGARLVGGGARPLALLRHQPVEVAEIDAAVARSRDLA